MKIFIVTMGSYSDYRIEAVFLDKKKAEKYRDMRDFQNDYDEVQIEEYETHDNEFKCEHDFKRGYIYKLRENFKEFKGIHVSEKVFKTTNKQQEIIKHFIKNEYFKSERAYRTNNECVAEITSYKSVEHLERLVYEVWQEYTAFQSVIKGLL